jgi:uncharacterized membrane protein
MKSRRRNSHATRRHANASGSAVADENIRAIEKILQKAEHERTLLQRLSDRVASIASHESAVILHAFWFAAWIGLNSGVGGLPAFDPFPFSLLTTIVSLEAIFLTLFVLSSQGRMTAEADRRAHLDLQINLLAEQEMTLVLRMLREICNHLGLDQTVKSEKFAELTRQTDVSEIARHLERHEHPP